MTLRWPAFALCLLAGTAAATDVELHAGQARYEATETAPGGFVLNRDSGVLRGGSVALTQPLAADWRLRLLLQSLHGSLRYDGLTQLGLPLTTSTGLRLQRAELALAAAAWAVPGGFELVPALALGEQRIERAIAATPASLPTTETMHSRFIAIDAAMRRSFGSAALQLALRAAVPLRQRLDIDTFGVYDSYSLQPQRQGSTRLTLRGEWAFAPGWTLAAEAGSETLKFGNADGRLVTAGGQPAAISSYPGSRQRLRSTAVAVTAAF
jgi:hypothetical protein